LGRGGDITSHLNRARRPDTIPGHEPAHSPWSGRRRRRG
jgi:hypothetical protein